MQELVEEIAESTSIEVRYDGPDKVRLDRTMMSRILLNLARNAANAGAGRIRIDVWRAGRLGVIDIADDGRRSLVSTGTACFMPSAANNAAEPASGWRSHAILRWHRAAHLSSSARPRMATSSEFSFRWRYSPAAGDQSRWPMIGVDGRGSMSHGKKIQVSCDTSVTKVSTSGRPAGLA